MKRFIILITLYLAMTTQVGATAITFNSTNGSNLSASATFDTSGSNLLVTLTNTSTFDVMVPVDVLTALFFTVSGDPTLTPVSALLNSGSIVWFGPDGSGNVGGEWAYKDGLSGAPAAADEGISSSGLGLFGPGDLFPPGTSLQGPLSPNGLQYGIASAGDNAATGNAAVTGGFALIQNSVVFTLSGLSAGFDPSAGSITNVSFQYGTSLTEPNISVPEPSTLLLLGSGLVGLGLFGRRRKG